MRSNAQSLPLMSEHAKLFSLPHVCFTAVMRSFMEQRSVTVGRRLPTGSSASLGGILCFIFFFKTNHISFDVLVVTSRGNASGYPSLCCGKEKWSTDTVLHTAAIVFFFPQLGLNLIWPKFTLLVCFCGSCFKNVLENWIAGRIDKKLMWKSRAFKIQDAKRWILSLVMIITEAVCGKRFCTYTKSFVSITFNFCKTQWD